MRKTAGPVRILPVPFVSRLLALALLAALILPLAASAALAEGSKHVMLQSFGWDSQNGGQNGKWYDLIAARAGEIASAGFTLIWLPPPTRSVSQQGYLPTDYYDLGSGSNPTFYGNIDQLSNCIAKLREGGVKVLADVVVNHRCAGKQDDHGLWNVYDFPSGLAKWDKKMICRDDRHFDGQGSGDTGDRYEAAPDLDHNNLIVQNDIIEWMKWLKKLGFEGWRYDYVKGYAPKFVGIYDEQTAPKFSVGELWTSMNYGRAARTIPEYDQNPHRQQLCNWLDNSGKTSHTFDFTTKGILQYAVGGEYWRLRDKDGKAAGLIGWWPERAVTFIDNHDTGSKQSHWPFPGDKVMQGYAYILTHPGVPCVFWEHYYDWNLKDQINTLIKIRREYNIASGSKLKILVAENGLYAASIDDRIVMKLGPRDYPPPQGFKLLASGNDYAVFGK